ncbi:hypothetical protein FHG87_002975 [Trinorchestia longiramus]|nr:hypothetical protein FHG87_002975 [Trinorchestia longiramus]
MAMSSLKFIALFASLGFTPAAAHPLETQNLVSHGLSEPQDLSSLISLEAPKYTSVSSASQMQPLNLSYTTVTIRSTVTVTTLQYHTCTIVASGTPPCRSFIVAPAETSILAAPTSVTSLLPSFFTASQMHNRLKNDGTSIFEDPESQPLSPKGETDDFMTEKSKLKVVLGSSVNVLERDADVLNLEVVANIGGPNFQRTEDNKQLKKSYRTPRLITGSSNIVLTKSVIESLTTTVTVTDSQTTVAITYGGCVPHAAVTATACSP